MHRAREDAVLYWVHDEPLMTYLGATASQPRFEPTHYPYSDSQRCLDEVARDPEAANRSRVSILLANRAMNQTLTMTHVLWAMFGILPEGGLQPPHRHQSVALDLVLDCEPGCYTLLGDLDEDSRHSHHNESGADAHIIPIQDAGLHTYLRTLDIRFMSRQQAAAALETSFDISPVNSLAGPVRAR